MIFFAEGLPQVQSSVIERGIKRQAIYVSELWIDVFLILISFPDLLLTWHAWHLTVHRYKKKLREGWRYQIGFIFGKSPNGLRPPRPPSLIFGKLHCKLFSEDVRNNQHQHLPLGLRCILPLVYCHHLWITLSEWCLGQPKQLIFYLDRLILRTMHFFRWIVQIGDITLVWNIWRIPVLHHHHQIVMWHLMLVWNIWSSSLEYEIKVEDVTSDSRDGQADLSVRCGRDWQELDRGHSLHSSLTIFEGT